MSAESGATKIGANELSLNKAQPAASLGSKRLQEKLARLCAPPQRLSSACRQSRLLRCLVRRTRIRHG